MTCVLVCGGTAMSPALFEVTAASLPLRWILLLLASLLLLGLALACWAWVRRARVRRQVPARLAPRLRHPIVLAHGVFGFDEIVFAGRRHHYFRNISERLAGPGARSEERRVG